MSQPASLTHVKQVLHNVHIAAQAGIDALMNKKLRGLLGYRYEVEAVWVGTIYLLLPKIMREYELEWQQSARYILPQNS